MAQRKFALKHLPDDELFKIVSTIYEVSLCKRREGRRRASCRCRRLVRVCHGCCTVPLGGTALMHTSLYTAACSPSAGSKRRLVRM